MTQIINIIFGKSARV